MQASYRRTSASYLIAAAVFCGLAACCLLYAQRDRLLVRYHASIAITADQPLSHSVSWLMDHVNLAAPHLMAHLKRRDRAGCDKAAELLERMLESRSDPTDPDQSHFTLALATRLHEQFRAMSAVGRIQAVELATKILNSQLGKWSPNVPTALETAGQLLLNAINDPDAEVQDKALRGLASAWAWDGPDNVAYSIVEDWKRQCYLRAVELLDSPSSGLRAAAARSIRGSPFHEGDVRLIALLSDPSHAVRKHALLALVHKADSLSFDQRTRLFSMLHDPDREVREATVQLLVNAGGSQQEIRLAILSNHPSAFERIKAATIAAQIAGPDAAWWLKRLMDDESSLVRLAAVRCSTGIAEESLRARLSSMAEKDVDPAVRNACKEQLARKIASKR